MIDWPGADASPLSILLMLDAASAFITPSFLLMPLRSFSMLGIFFADFRFFDVFDFDLFRLRISID